MFIGAEGSSEKTLAELGFVHRPEAWNTLFRAVTNSWEPVVHVKTGKGLYESADFTPLQALKTDLKPAAIELQHLKKRLEAGGWCLTIPPDDTPIYRIPCMHPTKSGDDATIDWETLRSIIEAGGRNDLRRIPSSEKVSAS